MGIWVRLAPIGCVERPRTDSLGIYSEHGWGGNVVAPDRDSAPIGSDMILTAAIIVISIISIPEPNSLRCFEFLGLGDSAEC
jgi:hypothetical protein